MLLGTGIGTSAISHGFDDLMATQAFEATKTQSPNLKSLTKSDVNHEPGATDFIRDDEK